MANITQQIPNFLGGVSTQPDDQKLPGQVRDIVNGYLDPTFGLVKRNGFVWKANLGSNSATTYATGHWFYYRYDSTEAYVGVIKNQTVKMWNVSTGVEKTISNQTGQSYLNGGMNDFHVVSRLDQILIVNKSITVATAGTTPGSLSGTVASIASLPAASSNNGAYYKVANTSAAEDDYYVVSDGSTWIEAAQPGIALGYQASTMPHRISRDSSGNFTFEVCPWANRTVGDLTTNPNASFVGKKISHLFYTNNRLGMLSDENVILSQPNKFFTFFSVSAQVLTDADPIDLACVSMRPVNLTAAIPVTQGVVLFSRQQQFMLFSDTGVLSPTQAVVKSISNYEVDSVIPPVENGSKIVFVNKTVDYCRTIEMYTQGQGDNPLFIDIGKEVTQYIPSSVDALFSNAQNSFVGMYDQTSRKAYFFRNYSEGNEVLMRGWYGWELPGNVQFMETDNDEIFAVTSQGTQLTLLSSQLNTIPTGTQVTSGSIKESNPSFDFIADPKATSNYATGKRFVNNETRIYIPFEIVSGLTPIAVQDAATGSTYSGFFKTCTTGTDSEGSYFAIPGKDITALDWLVGYKLEFKVDMPYLYYRADQFVDVTAYLSIHRINFSIGLSGQCNFLVTPSGQSQRSYEATTVKSNEYTFDSVPIEDRIVFPVPIVQKNTGYDLQISSDNPYVVSLTSAMWEGNYSTKFYRRA
tara:strand:+ start:691 stop:2772 length:2082 start_codon:yes stop_codon:yes gene_type:complete